MKSHIYVIWYIDRYGEMRDFILVNDARKIDYPYGKIEILSPSSQHTQINS